MAFNDNPIIDTASKNSEESENELRRLFTKRNGFILRQESPDYGVDFNVEVADDHSPTGKLFAIQLKSQENAVIIDSNNERFVSLQFKTSRLGYLYRRKPMYGIIVLYDVKTGKSYFDYVEHFITRLNDERGSYDWRDNDSVSIHFPIENILSEEKLKGIHERMLLRTRRTDAMVDTFGSLFGIPSDSTNIKQSNFNVNDLESLEVMGFGLAHRLRFGTLHEIFRNLSLNEILKSAKLIHLAAITYVERGNIMEGEYFLRKAIQNRGKYSDEEFASIEFLKIKADLVLGYIDEPESLERLLKLTELAVQEQNSLLLAINILSTRIAIMGRDDVGKTVYMDDAIAIFEKIKESKLDNEQKLLLNVYNCDNLSSAFAVYNMFMTAEFKTKEAFGEPIDKGNYIQWTRRMVSLNETVSYHIGELISYAQANNLQPLYAKALFLRASSIKNFMSSLLAVDMGINELVPGDEPIAKGMECANASFQLFNKFGLTGDAFHSLLIGYDLKRLKDVLIDGAIEIDNSELLKQIEQYKAANEIHEEAFSTVDQIIKNLTKRRGALMKDASDEEIAQLAERFASAQGFDEKQMELLLQDMQNNRLFETVCKKPELRLVHNTKFSDPLFQYRWAPTYSVINIDTNFEYGTHQDVKHLLRIIGYEVE